MQLLKSRKEILKLNSCFGTHLISVQKAKYNTFREWQAGESVLLDDSAKSVKLTKEKAEELIQQDKHYYLKNRDHFTSENRPTLLASANLISPKQNPKDYLNDLANALSIVSKEYGDLLILGDWNIPWLSQENDYPPVTRALDFLKQKIDKDFNGGFILRPKEILEFIPHLFWLTRCNGSLPQFMMVFGQSRTVVEICKYGTLHLHFYEKEEQDWLLRFFHEEKFIEVKSCSDPIDFDLVL